MCRKLSFSPFSKLGKNPLYEIIPTSETTFSVKLFSIVKCDHNLNFAAFGRGRFSEWVVCGADHHNSPVFLKVAHVYSPVSFLVIRRFHSFFERKKTLSGTLFILSHTVGTRRWHDPVGLLTSDRHRRHPTHRLSTQMGSLLPVGTCTFTLILTLSPLAVTLIRNLNITRSLHELELEL